MVHLSLVACRELLCAMHTEADPASAEHAHTLEACAYFLRQLSFADIDNQAAIYRVL